VQAFLQTLCLAAPAMCAVFAVHLFDFNGMAGHIAAMLKGVFQQTV
jgi:hypothetical protein